MLPERVDRPRGRAQVAGSASPSSRSALPPMTFAIVAVREAGLEQRVGELDHARSRRTAPGRRRRSPSRARRARPRRRRRRSGSSARSRRRRRRRRRSARTRSRPGRRVAAIPRRCSSDRLRALSHDAAHARCARRRPAASPSRGRRRSWPPRRGRRRRASRRASIRSTISRPAGGQAALLDAVRGAAEGVVEEVARRHHPEAGVGDDLDVGRVVVERVGALDREQPGGDRPVRPAAAEVRGEVGPRADDREAAVGAARHRVGPRGQVERPGEQAPPRRAAASPSASASRMTSSLRSSLRSMLRWRGDFVLAAKTWRATLPSIRRGTSTWPRSPRCSRSRPHSSESAWRSATPQRLVEGPRPLGGADSGRRSRFGHSRALGPRHQPAAARPGP